MRNSRKKSYKRTEKRGSGILLHITSLPSLYGIGDLGPQAYEFADFLTQAKQRYWQILPLNATDYKHEYSPYNCMSAFAGNKYLISPDLLREDGFLKSADLKRTRRFSQRTVDFPASVTFKEYLFDKAYARFRNMKQDVRYQQFCEENAWWLDDYALFAVFKDSFHNVTWTDWPAPVADRDPYVLRSLRRLLKPSIEREKFLQFIFTQQWNNLKSYCNNKHISLIGDVPIYVDFNSVDVWVHRKMFKLGRDGKPAYLSGVPPDYFSRDGQLWGNPVYHWRNLARSKYSWWVKRIEHNLTLFDSIRMDHFRGFAAYWQVPARSRTARHGRWVKAPGVQFLRVLRERFKKLNIIAEDLGTITPDVHALMQHFHLPGMRVLVFAFGDGGLSNPYLPHNHIKHCVVYTGTHDNNTVRGWFEDESSRRERQMLFSYIGKRLTARKVHEAFIRMAMSSVADTAIISMQDILGLNGHARMNRPASIGGNWRWRLMRRQLTPSVAGKLRAWTEMFGRG